MDKSQEIMRGLEKAMMKLQQIWNRLGIVETQKQARSNAVKEHLLHLLDDMVEEEEFLEKQILERLDVFTAEVKELTRELDLPEYKPATTGMTVLEKEKAIKTEADCLRKEKQERLKILRKLHTEDQNLCDTMCMTPYYIPSGKTPSGEQLDALREHVKTLTAEKEKRFKTFLHQKKDIYDLMKEMDRTADNDFERQILREDATDFVLSTENIRGVEALLTELVSSKTKLEKAAAHLWDRLHLLWERLDTSESYVKEFTDATVGFKPKAFEALKAEIKRGEKLKLQHIQKFVESTRLDLIEWWDRCFYSQDQRDDFIDLYRDDYSEELLERFEKEVAGVKDYYEANCEILNKVTSWHGLFKQMVEFDKKANDPNRFFHDRGGKLLLEEKARKKLMKDLPKVESTVKEEVIVWEKKHGRQFRIGGKPFHQYLEQTWHDYQEAKTKEKEDRQKAKTRLMEEEMIYGSKPSTPVKRRIQAGSTPTKTPKFRKVNESRTPASCSRIQTSTMFSTTRSKAPLSASKFSTASKVVSTASKNTPGSRQRRRSNRVARKVLGEYTAGTNETNIFSHTTVSGGNTKYNVTSGGDFTIGSTGSYQDFAASVSENVHHSTHIHLGQEF